MIIDICMGVKANTLDADEWESNSAEVRIGMSWNRCKPVPRAICAPVQLLGHKSRGSTPNAAERASKGWRMQSRGWGP